MLPEGDNSVRALQLYIRATRHSRCGLERLQLCGPPCHSLLSLVASHPHLRQLRELDLSRCAVDLLSCPNHGLPHLSTLRLSVQRIWCGNDDRYDPDLEQAFAATCQQLVASYSAQLTRLSVAAVSASSLASWFRLLCTQCRRLETLTVGRATVMAVLEHEPPLELQLETPPSGHLLLLPELKHLKLGWLPLTDSSLLSVFSLCPELETLYLPCLRHVTEAGQEPAFRCCPKLSNKADYCRDW
jgi:hypothetical protein